ncbi:hypothetical protein CRM22_000541 [Opisthorchis felineus]|uniref:CDC20/Fizzy WD40 domain-containing protein n=1 Tax=Opisthorchis felineus TaxID=147828 RepID=A0A4S2MEL4_OPIFE|nr:hypothetical protein CRM22_000541 [Opisthorchis felineus]
MAHSSFARSLSEVSSGDGSLFRTLQDGGHSSGNSSVTTSVLLAKGRSSQKTPSRTPSRLPLTPCRMEGDRSLLSSRKTPGQSVKTPGGSSGRSLLEREGDRFIPNRVTTDLNRARHAIKDGLENAAPEDMEYRRAVSESLFGGDSVGTQILRYKSNFHNEVQSLPVKRASPPRKAVSKRVIPRAPEKVLDAPEIMDDFYLNILDWSANNILAVALNQEVYLWNASSGDIACLMSAGLDNEYVSCLSWSPDAPSVIAIGLSTGRVQLWSSETRSLLRTMRLDETDAAGRVPVVAWREHILTSGSRSGHIRHHDTRVARHEVGVSNFHSQEVCGLAWSPDKQFLASGANDNCVAIWSASATSRRDNPQPELTLADHHAAVKALAWCPWKNNLLCTGGGTADHKLRFWNATTGNCAKSVDVVAQVSGVVWNSEYRELLTSHGTPLNRLVVWRYPDISCVAELMEHQGRVLCVSSSPNNDMVASCGSDETLRIWHCFEVDNAKKRAEERNQRAATLTRAMR